MSEVESKTHYARARVAHLVAPGATTESIICPVQGCGVPTKERKPYCSDHCYELPYPKRILEEIARQEHEDAVAVEGKAAPTAVTAQDILTFLETMGPRSVARLSRETNVDVSAIRTYVVVLQSKGLVVTAKSNRGKTIVQRTEKAR